MFFPLDKWLLELRSKIKDGNLKTTVDPRTATRLATIFASLLKERRGASRGCAVVFKKGDKS